MPETDRRTRYLPGTKPPVLLFLLLWILFSSMPPLLITGEFVPLNLFPDGVIHQVVLAVQLSYLILGLPLLLSGHVGLDRGIDDPRNTVDWNRLFRYLLFALVLVVLGVPAFLVAGKMADAPAQYLFQGQLQVCSLVFGIGLVWWGAGRGRNDWFPPLFAGLLVMTVIAPLMYAGLAQVGGAEYSFLLNASPVVAAFREEPVMFVSPRVSHSLLAITAGVMICAVLRLTRGYCPAFPDGWE